MIGKRIRLWKDGEYDYPGAYGFIPFMVSYIHEDQSSRPGMLIAPGGAYRRVSPSEAHLPAEEFYRAGYNVFVLAYTVNYLDEPLKLQPLADISRAVRMIRAGAVRWHIDPEKIAVCGFSAGGHLCASLCVHYKDIKDPAREYSRISNRPDAAVLCYPVITAGEYSNRESFLALLGEHPADGEREYLSLEAHVTGDVPPCFLWHTAGDATVPVENTYLFADACRKAGVPYAQHVFTEGIHGLSTATERWILRDFGQPYTLEQIRFLAEAVKAGKTDLPPGRGEEILEEFGLAGKKKEKWTPEMKEKLYGTIQEVGVWTELAEKWLARRLKLSLAGEGI